MSGAQISENIRIICGRISHAAIRAGRRPEDIKLIAVTKTTGIQQIKEAIGAGLRIFGESKVQEAREKIEDARCMIHDAGIQWHLIGHLQKNKAKTAVELFDIIHSVDSLELAEAIHKHASMKRAMKAGPLPESAVTAFIYFSGSVSTFPMDMNISLTGLMSLSEKHSHRDITDIAS